MTSTAEQEMNPLAQSCLQDLMRIWFEFERSLSATPIIRRLLEGHFSTEDYLNLLLNLRQQVIEGSRWISRAASSFDRNYSDIRSIVISHAQDEHRDYELLEKDYVSLDGDIKNIQSRDKNIGSEALHGFLMHRASQPNPIDLLGAMWIVEGLGQKMADEWSERIDTTLKTQKPCTRFMKYHAQNDDDHMGKLYQMLDRVCVNQNDRAVICQTAKVVARLYVLQIEEVDED